MSKVSIVDTKKSMSKRKVTTLFFGILSLGFFEGYAGYLITYKPQNSTVLDDISGSAVTLHLAVRVVVMLLYPINLIVLMFDWTKIQTKFNSWESAVARSGGAFVLGAMLLSDRLTDHILENQQKDTQLQTVLLIGSMTCIGLFIVTLLALPPRSLEEDRKRRLHFKKRKVWLTGKDMVMVLSGFLSVSLYSGYSLMMVMYVPPSDHPLEAISETATTLHQAVRIVCVLCYFLNYISLFSNALTSAFKPFRKTLSIKTEKQRWELKITRFGATVVLVSALLGDRLSDYYIENQTKHTQMQFTVLVFTIAFAALYAVLIFFCAPRSIDKLRAIIDYNKNAKGNKESQAESASEDPSNNIPIVPETELDDGLPFASGYSEDFYTAVIPMPQKRKHKKHKGKQNKGKSIFGEHAPISF